MTKKVEETDIVMMEVEAVSAQYRPLAQACSFVYFTLESLNQVLAVIVGLLIQWHVLVL